MQILHALEEQRSQVITRPSVAVPSRLRVIRLWLLSIVKLPRDGGTIERKIGAKETEHRLAMKPLAAAIFDARQGERGTVIY